MGVSEREEGYSVLIKQDRRDSSSVCNPHQLLVAQTIHLYDSTLYYYVV